jgi:uncharacterized alpha-E superfamily protein
MNSLNQVFKHVKVINKNRQFSKDSAAFLIGKVRAEYEYKLIEEIDDDLQIFIENILHSLTKISEKIEAEYFNY